MTIDTQKLNIVSKILSINSRKTIHVIEQAIERIEREEVDTLEDISHYIGNIEAKVDIEKLKSEQAIQPLSITELDALIEEANFTESIDELLESIKS